MWLIRSGELDQGNIRSARTCSQAAAGSARQALGVKADKSAVRRNSTTGAAISLNTLPRFACRFWTLTWAEMWRLATSDSNHEVRGSTEELRHRRRRSPSSRLRLGRLSSDAQFRRRSRPL